ncbi:MAG: thymidylate synthase [Rickettsiales bacterium]|nr:thymidylate synthase [Rickettsiales bacterium]
MKQYLDILRECRDYPDYDWELNKRTGLCTIGVIGAKFKHNMADGFPLLTTKQVYFKGVAAELEFFLQGITDKQWLKDRNCRIWNEWARPSIVNAKVAELANQSGNNNFNETAARNSIADAERDLGPIYGYQWRYFSAEYPGFDSRDIIGIDQVSNVLKQLKKDPSDRRMIVSAWNPKDIPDMALPPCHILHQVLVKNGTLSLSWYQRSCDMFLGVPFNIASYALLLKLYAKEGGFKEGWLVGFLNDAHIYENHTNQVDEQLSREPKPLPDVEIENWNGMMNWKASDCVLKNYLFHPVIKAEVAR